MAIECRGDAPNPSFSIAKLQLLIRRVLMKTVRRVGNYGMNAIVLLFLDPIETVGVE
jgi:hypothetical protein